MMEDIMEETKEWYYAIDETVYGPIYRSEITRLYNNRCILSNTKVWKNGMSDWINYDQTDLINNVTTPPPLHKTEIDNSYVWSVAFMPLCCLVLIMLFINSNRYIGLFISCCIGLVSMVICIIDERTTKKLGYDTKELFLWAILLVPVYLFKRAYLLKQSKGYAITWLVSYSILIFINFGIIFARLL
jgi:hypothetical protein